MRPLGFLLLVSLIFILGCVQPQTNAGGIESTVPVQSTIQSIDGVDSQSVNYFESVNGFLAKPSVPGDYPGVVLIHEWWGLNDNIKHSAQKLAKEGYVVLAVDLYNGKVATTSDEALKLVGGIDQGLATQNMRAAVHYLRVQEHVPRVGSWGWCFGGGQSLQLAVSGESLDATVVYYGQPIQDVSKLQSIDWPLLGIFGAEDKSIPVSSVDEFVLSLNSANVSSEIHVYPGVGHAFANPSNPNYAPAETEDAWKGTLNFLKKYLYPSTDGE